LLSEGVKVMNVIERRTQRVIARKVMSLDVRAVEAKILHIMRTGRFMGVG
jgi:hypothetical protein